MTLTSPGRRDSLTLTVSGRGSDMVAIPPGYDAVLGILTGSTTDAFTGRGAVTVEVSAHVNPSEATTTWAPVRQIAATAASQSLTGAPIEFPAAMCAVRLRCDGPNVRATLTLCLEEL